MMHRLRRLFRPAALSACLSAALGCGARTTLSSGEQPDPGPVDGGVACELGGCAQPLAAGSYYSLALRGTGAAWSWGTNLEGELGLGEEALYDTFPLPTPIPALDDLTAVSAGLHSLALGRDGVIWAFGRNTNAQLGDGTYESRAVPQIVPGLSGVTAIAAGGVSSLALREDGSVWGFGSDDYGQLGDGTLGTNPTPVAAVGLSGVIAIAAGTVHSLALRSDGSVWAWGFNLWGQVGEGAPAMESVSIPIEVPGIDSSIAIAAGGMHSLALRADGSVWAWGSNERGQLGAPGAPNSASPILIEGLTDVTAIAAGESYSLALRADGTVWAWGANYAGQLGDGGPEGDRAEPAPVAGLDEVTFLSAGSFHALALRADGSVWAWGDGQSGAVGDGSLAIRRTPVPVALEAP